MKLICKASTVISAYVYSVETKWNFQNLSDKVKTLPANAVSSDSNNRTHAVSELLLSKVSSVNVGKYYCSALLHVTKPEPETSMADIYFKSVKIDKGNSMVIMICVVKFVRNHSFSTYTKFLRKTNISYPLIRTRTCAYQGVKNVSFSGNLAYVLNE